MEEVYRGIWVVAYRELIRFFQERSRVFSSFGMPLIFLVIFGAGFSRIIGNLTPGVNYIQFMFPGIIAMTVLMSSVFSGLSVVWDREFGFLREVLVAPLNRGGIVLGIATGNAVTAIIQGYILLVLSPVVGATLTGRMALEMLPVLIVLSLSLSGLGILVASRMRSQQGFQLVVQVLIFPLIFLAGVFFPVNNVPTWLEVLTKIDPVTYGVDAIRQLFLGGSGVAIANPMGGSSIIGVTIFGHTMTMWQDLALVAGFGIILMVLGIWSFSRQE
jgi:ABC-2 type transport system permease protein